MHTPQEPPSPSLPSQQGSKKAKWVLEPREIATTDFCKLQDGKVDLPVVGRVEHSRCRSCAGGHNLLLHFLEAASIAGGSSFQRGDAGLKLSHSLVMSRQSCFNVRLNGADSSGEASEEVGVGGILLLDDVVPQCLKSSLNIKRCSSSSRARRPGTTTRRGSRARWCRKPWTRWRSAAFWLSSSLSISFAFKVAAWHGVRKGLATVVGAIDR